MGGRSYNIGEQAAPVWTERAAICCDLLDPAIAEHAVASLSDIGCGDQKLKRLIKQRGWALSYRGFDIIPQSDEVEPLDLNLAAPPGHADVAAALGLLEYVDDVGACLGRLAEHAPMLVVSHTTRDGDIYSAEMQRERGWKNHLYASEFAALLTDHGWGVADERATLDRRTRIWLAKLADGRR